MSSIASASGLVVPSNINPTGEAMSAASTVGGHARDMAHRLHRDGIEVAQRQPRLEKQAGLEEHKGGKAVRVGQGAEVQEIHGP